MTADQLADLADVICVLAIAFTIWQTVLALIVLIVLAQGTSTRKALWPGGVAVVLWCVWVVIR